MKFTQTPQKPNSQELKEDFLEYFDGKEDDDDDSLVRNKSDFTPPKNQNNALENFINNLENMPKSNVNIKCKENVTKQQREAIKRLSEDRSIIIK